MAVQETTNGSVRALLDRMLIKRNTSDRLGLIPLSVDPEDVAAYLSSAARGDLGRLQELYLKMEATDGRYSGLCNSTRSAVAAFPLRVFPGTDSAEARQVADVVRFMIQRLQPSELVRRLAQFYIRGVTVDELMWSVVEYEGTPYAMVVDVLRVPGSRLRMDMQRDSETFGLLKITSPDNPTGDVVTSFPVGKLLIRTDGAEPGFFDIGGAARRCLSWYLTKIYSQKWWNEFNEVYGEPMRVAFVPEMPDEERQVVKSFLETLGHAMYGMFPEGTSIQLIESSRQGTIQTYGDIIDLANNEMTVAFFGGVQAVDGGGSGSYAKAEVHMQIRHEIIESVATGVNESLREIVEHFVRFNLGDQFPIEAMPVVKVVPHRPADLHEMAEVFNIARQYIEIPKQHVYDVLAIPEPRPEDEVLEAPFAWGNESEGWGESDGDAESSPPREDAEAPRGSED